MHLVITTAFMSISLVLALTQVKGHSIAFHVWEWFKNLFHKKSGSSTRTWISFRTKKLEFIYSSQSAATPQELVAPALPNLLEQFPLAAGGKCLTPPHLSSGPVGVPCLPPPPTPAQYSVNVFESQEDPTKSPSAPKRSRARARLQRENGCAHTPRKVEKNQR